jgi:biopolymer transport protein ExbB
MNNISENASELVVIEEKESMIKSLFATIVIPLALITAVLIYIFVLGDGSHFEGGNNQNHPKPGDYIGMVYKGGMIVPVLMSLLIIVLTFVIERALTVGKAKGKGSVNNFVGRIRALLIAGDLASADAECDNQQGSVANVVKSGLRKYKEMELEQGMDKEQKVLAIQKELEEATALELPMLERNLVILATIASVATLMGLLGTVIGMIRAFAALATAGAPDSVALANGISEALINTALGIGTSAIAIIAYNYFTTKIDKLTYSIDEAGFSIIQTFASKHKHK